MNAEIKENTKPLISVIVPVYNAETTLKNCLDSILNQSFKSYEVIVVDDGSTDASPEICDSYKEAYGNVKVIHQENYGVSAARNAALELAVGDWLAFCDSDDTVCDYWLSSLYGASEGTGLVVCGYNYFRQEHPDAYPVQKTLGHKETFTEIDVLLERLISKKLFQNIWNKLFRRSIVVQGHISFKEAFNVFEDEYFVLDYLSKVDNVVCIPECAYNYYSPADYLNKYDCGIDAFQEVVGKMYEALAYVTGRIKLPSMVKWYRLALARYVQTHTYAQTKDRLAFARKLASNFHDGPFNHLSLRILPSRIMYLVLKSKTSAD